MSWCEVPILRGCGDFDSSPAVQNNHCGRSRWGFGMVRWSVAMLCLRMLCQNGLPQVLMSTLLIFRRSTPAMGWSHEAGTVFFLWPVGVFMALRAR